MTTHRGDHSNDVFVLLESRERNGFHGNDGIVASVRNEHGNGNIRNRFLAAERNVVLLQIIETKVTHGKLGIVFLDRGDGSDFFSSDMRKSLAEDGFILAVHFLECSKEMTIVKLTNNTSRDGSNGIEDIEGIGAGDGSSKTRLGSSVSEVFRQKSSSHRVADGIEGSLGVSSLDMLDGSLEIVRDVRANETSGFDLGHVRTGINDYDNTPAMLVSAMNHMNKVATL